MKADIEDYLQNTIIIDINLKYCDSNGDENPFKFFLRQMEEKFMEAFEKLEIDASIELKFEKEWDNTDYRLYASK
jgi:hypothetical protein